MIRAFIRGALALLVLASSVALTIGMPVQSASADSSKVVETKTVTRSHVIDGAAQEVDSRTVTLTVSETKDLRSRQEIEVSWTGAHPTGGKYSDQNAAEASNEEYPFVLLQCRGVDSKSVPVDDQLRPETCWTSSAQERFNQESPFPAWRLDRYASASDRTATPGQPKSLPDGCYPPAEARWVPFVAADGEVYPGGPYGCDGLAPESANVGGNSLPSNTTYGVTERDGSGSAQFDVWTDDDNASLGCNSEVKCALVAIPIVGISCDPAGAGLPEEDRVLAEDRAKSTADCTTDGVYAPGSNANTRTQGATAVSGRSWWSESNWRNRITVPLSLAPSQSTCDIGADLANAEVYGSELLTQATQQWSPHFCLDKKLFRLKHVEVGEPEARHVLESGTVNAAASSQIPAKGFKRKVVNAPTAVTGFTIGYTIDDENGRPYKKLKLTPRLLAKLLTESYPANKEIASHYTALQGNPLDVSRDPEFQSLNPGVPLAFGEAPATLLALSSDSDVMYALTSYIDADPDARAWLNGTPDPWGMTVNPAYKDIDLPIDSWPLLDEYISDSIAVTNWCLESNPVPFLPLVAAPMSRLRLITQALQFSVSNSQTTCQALTDSEEGPSKLVAAGRQTAGQRFVLGVTSYGAAQRYGIDNAALLSRVEPSASAKFDSDSGRTFVAPSASSLREAVKLATFDKKSASWPVPYAKLRNVGVAYPGTMVVYTSVPSVGLSEEDAKNYAQFLRYVAGPGQTPGLQFGQLAPGYLPMTKANGLTAFVAYTEKAADTVESQGGAFAAEPAPTATATPTAGTTAGVGTPPTSVVPSVAPVVAVVSAPVDTNKSVLVALGQTLGLGSGVAALVLPIVLLLALCAGAIAGGVFFVNRYGGYA